jgi:1,2-dihydroxy-3-keto-5-methylthiopentene dioxygenase
MAVINIPDENRRIDDPAAVNAFLAPYGICHERWPLADRVDPSASPEAILAAYAPEIDRLKERGGYTTADVINVTPETPGLEAMLDRFRSEHTHSEDEVRFILKGRGLFFIHPSNSPVFTLQVEEGDLINVPAGTQHWFDLCADRTIRAIRLFQDKSGWTPHYVEHGIHGRYAPVCWGPSYLPAGGPVQAAVKP